MQIEEKEFSIPFFLENGFKRKKCPLCGSHYWTQNPDSVSCGDSPCQPYTFIQNPPTKRAFTLPEMRRLFITYFEKNGHTPIDPYPVVARWRNDVYLVGASIYDFQPYVTEGIAPPPANPLVVSQPCLRFTDLDNVGPTAGRHLVVFEMGGAHAFNYPDKEVYWKNETISLHHRLLVEELGVNSEAVSYKEHFWSGGGNAGPDVEACVSGLEISTLVFMSYKTIDGSLLETPIKTVDTGYGLERWTWLSQGAPTGFHAIYGGLIREIEEMAGIKEDLTLIVENTKLISSLSFETPKDRFEARERLSERLNVPKPELNKLLSQMEAIYALVDHAKAIAFMLSEGVIPSNVEEGYLARLLVRRSLRLLRLLGIEGRLQDIMWKQIETWRRDFPRLGEMRDEILEALSVEEEKYARTLAKGEVAAQRVIQETKNRGLKTVPPESLIQLYDSHGLTPEFVKEVAEKFEVEVAVPENFFALVAERHCKPRLEEEPEEWKALQEKVKALPATKLLYYEDAELMKFTAVTLAVLNGQYVVLDKTCFYPEGGGQVSDTGYLKFNGQTRRVLSAQKVGLVVVHKLDGAPPKPGMTVEGLIDEDRRRSLMRHHTATHILIGAARRILGEHAWQAGARKEADRSRLDISHYKPLTWEEVKRLEEMACEVVVKDLPIEVSWTPRHEAEKRYGFRIYQGGAVPGKELRIVDIKGWDVEACGGTHCRRTGEVGLIKILKVERPQDGVERLIFATGPQALRHIQETESVALKAAEHLKTSLASLERAVRELVEKEKVQRKKLVKLMLEVVESEAVRLLGNAVKVDGLKVVTAVKEDGEEENLIKLASRVVELDPSTVAAVALKDKTARIFVSAGKKAEEMGVHAGKIASEVAEALGGGGGGKSYFGQGGGTKVRALEEALRRVEEHVRKRLKEYAGKG